jgi:transglutaminase-like putative cysteine protease
MISIRAMQGWSDRLTREARDTLWLLGMLTLVLLPHATRLPWWCSLTAALSLGWRALLAVRDAPLPSRWVLILLAMASLAMTWLSHKTLFGREAGITLVVILTTLKCLELRARRDSLVCLYLGFFLILTQFFYGQGIGTALLMLVGVWGLLLSLILGQRPQGRPPLRAVGKEAARAMMYGLPLMVILFVLFPRIGPLWSLPRDATARTGLSNELTLGQVAELAQDGGIALRVRFTGKAPATSALYFRGPTLDRFDGRQWRPAPPLLEASPTYTLVGAPVRYQITIEPQSLNVLPLLDGTGQVQAVPGQPLPRLQRHGAQWYAANVNKRRLQMQGLMWPRAFEGPAEETRWLREWLALPRGFNPRTLAWAAQLRQRPDLATANATQLAQAVLTHIRGGQFRYTLSPGLPDDPDERHLIDDFWLDRQAGYCEHFASAFVVIMRALDVPARVVTGYQGAELNPVDDQYIVRNSNAHAWAEIWQAGTGWIRVDPTAAVAPERIERNPDRPPLAGLPGALGTLDSSALRRLRSTWEAVDHRWNVWVLQYSQGQQLNLMRKMGWPSPNWSDLGQLLAVCLGVLALVSPVWLSLRRWWRPAPPWPQILQSVHQTLLGLGLPAPRGPSPAAASSWVASVQHAPPELLDDRLKQALLRLLHQLDHLHYGPPPTPTDSPRLIRDRIRQARAIARQLQGLCKGHRSAAPQS